MDDLPISPLFYHQKGKVSDKEWILRRMREIPEAKQQETSNEYERIFLAERRFADARRKANTFLNGVSIEYRRLKY